MDLTEVLRNSDCSPEACDVALRMVEKWAEHNAEDWKEQTLATEFAFSSLLGSVQAVPVYLAGIVDRISLTKDLFIMNEWKTTQVKSDRSRWGEREWLASILRSDQLAAYALAFSDSNLVDGARRLAVRVRACARTPHGLEVWPHKRDQELYTFGAEELEAVRTAYLNHARARLALLPTSAPWQWVGQHCTQYFRDCPFLSECRSLQHPPSPAQRFDPAPYKDFGVPQDAPAVVVSHSSYETWNSCLEKYRRRYECGQRPEGDDTFELQVGRAFHLALATLYKGDTE